MIWSLLLSLAAAGAQAPPAPALPGRESDGRVAQVTFRLTTAARARCASTETSAGLVVQHLSQFGLADRPGMATAAALDRGPGIAAIVPGGPAAIAGIEAGDVLLAIHGVAVPPESALDRPFDARRAHARADLIDDLLTSAAPLSLDLLRHGAHLHLTVSPRPACTARVRLARSRQRNAYADGRHVFLTTGLLALLRSDDEVAFVIAHELAHNQLGHAALLRDAGVGHGLGRTLGRRGRVVRGSEQAADEFAGEMMLDAGFDPVAGAQLLPRLGSGDLGIALFASHASDKDRVEAMRRLVVARAVR